MCHSAHGGRGWGGSLYDVTSCLAGGSMSGVGVSVEGNAFLFNQIFPVEVRLKPGSFTCLLNVLFNLPVSSCVIVCPLGAVWAYHIKVPYLLVWHRKRLFTRLNKVTLCFSFGHSHQSLKVREVKCIPRDPAISALFYLKGPTPRCLWLSFT